MLELPLTRFNPRLTLVVSVGCRSPFALLDDSVLETNAWSLHNILFVCLSLLPHQRQVKVGASERLCFVKEENVMAVVQ